MSLAVTVLSWLVVAAGCWVGYQLLQQGGRVLLRLERLERELGELRSAIQSPRAPVPAAPAVGVPVLPRGLSLGGAAPDFELPDLAGTPTSLARFRGRRLLLVFFNPRCGYCVRMAPALGALRLDSDGPLPVVVSTGDAEENRRLADEHGIHGPVLLQQAMEVASEYQARGTPMGYLLDEQGRVASELAVGAEALLALARKPALPTAAASGPSAAAGNGTASKREHRGNSTLAESRIARNGLEAGTVAPDFRLPRLGGGELSLGEFRGRRVVLVFSDPHCGPCQALAPELEAFHRTRRAPRLLVVSRGDAAANAAKVTEAGLTFPVVLQRQWEISRAYGIFATPVAYEIDEHGVIARDVARGAEAILGLCRAASLS